MAKRSRSGAAPGAPKPKIEPAKVPVMRTRGFRWSLAGLLGIGILVLVLSLMGRAHRTGALDTYDRDLARAMRPYSQHQSETVPDSFLNVPTRFSQGDLSAKRLKEAATQWQEDFTKAAGQVRALTPPEQLKEAQEMIAQSLDASATIAGDYVTLADQQAAADGARGPVKQRLQKVVDDWLARINAARANASSLLASGRAVIEQLKRDWDVDPEASVPPVPGGEIPGTIDPNSIPGLQIPDGGGHSN